MVEKYNYGAYGNPYEGRFINMQKNNPYGFTGQRFEPELRMYSFAYRTYDPMSMRWMTPDPIRDGTNWYQYCMSDPVNYIDPDGRVVYENKDGNDDWAWHADEGDSFTSEELGFSENEIRRINPVQKDIEKFKEKTDIKDCSGEKVLFFYGQNIEFQEGG